MAKKKNDTQVFEYGSLHNAAVRLKAPREWYTEKKNGDLVMKTKVSVNCRIRVRLSE